MIRGEPAYARIAAELRARITSGDIPPDGLLPSVRALSETHGVARETVQRAMDQLRADGLIVSDMGHGYRARVQPERQPVAVPRGARVISRPALSDEERADLGLDDAEHVIVVTVGGIERGRYGADHVVLTFS
jgi:DNA-binding transcriptional regulator YhcF (GntR family)